MILVGEEEAKFSIHTGLLQRTSFFAKEGQPKDKPDPKADRETPTSVHNSARDTTAEPSFFLPEREQTVNSEQDAPPIIDLVDANADFVLKGKFYFSRDAFNVFSMYLNDALPINPATSGDCEALFKTYALATRYDAGELQDQIIDSLQAYYMHLSKSSQLCIAKKMVKRSCSCGKNIE